MGKKISETDRLLDFALNASEESLTTAIDTLRSVQRNRFTQKTAKPRAARTKKPGKVEPGTLGIAAGSEG